MKKLYKNQVRTLATLLLVAVCAVAGFAQGVVFVNSPANLGGPRADVNSGWWQLDTMTNQICSDLVLAGGLGNNDSLAGAAPISNAAAIAGKIVVIYRGTFSFAVKVNNAVAAGAIGVIMVQKDGTAPIIMGGAPTTPIPAVMLSKADGDALVAAMRAGQTVNICMGKTNLQNNLKVSTYAPIYSAFPRELFSALSPNTDSLFNLAGGEVYNLGLSDQHNLSLHTTVTHANGYVAFDKTFSGTDTCSTIDTPADTLIITNGSVKLKDYGVYTFNSTLSSMESEQYPVDNVSSNTININDFYISKVPVNPNTFAPIVGSAYTTGGTADPHPGFETGFLFDVKGNGFELDTIKFAAAGQFDLSGKTVSVALYSVADADGTGSVETDGERNIVAVKDYTFPALTGTAKTAVNQAALGFSAADAAFLTDGTRYLVTVTAPSTSSTDRVYIGFSNAIDYEGTVSAFFGNAALKPTTPYNTYLYNIGTAAHFRSGFGLDLSPAITVRVKNTLVPIATTRETINSKVNVFPNPTSGLVRVDLTKFNGEQSNITVTNLLGSTITSLTNQTGVVSIDLSAQPSGMYSIVVTNAQGQAVKKVSLTK
jgi:hypothetical protein